MTFKPDSREAKNASADAGQHASSAGSTPSPTTTAAPGKHALTDLATPAGGGAPLPGELRARFEARGGVLLDDVRVHHGSPRPAEIGARAYAYGADIYLAPGEEALLPHEAWHVVQQRQHRVPATGTIAGLPLNTDAALEAEADAADQISSGQSAGGQGSGGQSAGGQTAGERAPAGAAPRAVHATPVVQGMHGTSANAEQGREARVKEGVLHQQAQLVLFKQLTNENRSLAARQDIILAHNSDAKLLHDVRNDVYHFRQSNLHRADELLAVIKYLRFAENGAEPQSSLPWLHEMIDRHEGGEPEAWLGSKERVSDLSIHQALAYAQKRFAADDEEPPEATIAYLRGLGREAVALCSRAPFHTAAHAVALLGEIAKDARGGFGRRWAGESVIGAADVLRRRCAEPKFDWSEADVWSLTKLAGGLAPLARRDPGVDHLLEILTPRINQELGGAGPEMKRRDRYYDRFLVGTLSAYGQLGHRTVDTYRTFELAGPPLEELSATFGRPLSNEVDTGIHVRDGKPRMTPENLAESLMAYGRMLGRTDFDNLPPELRATVLELVKAARYCVPKSGARVRPGILQFNQEQLVQLTAALLLFRNPPEEVQRLLESARAPTVQTLEQNQVPTEALDELFYSLGIARGDHADLAPAYRAAVGQLRGRVEHHVRPGPDVVRLAVSAYEGRDVLDHLAEWYERQASADARTRDPGLGERDPRAIAEKLHASAREVGPTLEAMLALLLTNVRTALPHYSMITRRQVLHELTRLRSLPAARLPDEIAELERAEEGALPVENQLAEQVADAFTTVGADAELHGDLTQLPPVRLAHMLADYAWLRAPRESDRALIAQLIEILANKCATAPASELGRVVIAVGRIRRPDQPVQQFLDQLVVIVARRIAVELDALDSKFYADVLGGLRELPSAVAMRFVELMGPVIEARLRRRDDQARFVNLLRVCGTFVRLEDAQLNNERDAGTETLALRNRVIVALRSSLALNYDRQALGEQNYDREKARSTRETLPWRDYDRHFEEAYPSESGETVANARRDSEARFANAGPATGMTTTEANSYRVYTVSPSGDALRSQIMDNVIFRELTNRSFDFVFVELPAKAHLDRFKGVVSFRGKNFRYDVYGGSKLKAQNKPDRTKESTIQAIGVEEGAIAFFESMFNFQEGFFYAQRALFPNSDKPTVGLTGDLRVRVYPDELPSFKFGDLPFRTYDGWGFVKQSVAKRMSATRKIDHDRPPERGGKVPTQALQWYPENQAMIDEAVANGKRAVAQSAKRPEPTPSQPPRSYAEATTGKKPPKRAPAQALDPEVDTLYRALTTGQPPMRNAVAVPVDDQKVVLPASSPLYRGATEGLVMGRTPYDNPNLKPVPGENVTFREPGNEQQAPSLAASDFLGHMESVQYTLTGYTKKAKHEDAEEGKSAQDDGAKEAKPGVGGLAFFKGMLGIVDDKAWPEELANVDIALSNSDIKLDEAWEGEEKKPKIEAVTDLLVQGMLVVKQWFTPDYHVGVPTKTQKWLAGDYDGDLDAIMFRHDNPMLYDTVAENYREDGVSSKLEKTFTPSDGVRTRSKQIQDVMSPVLGMWSTLSDRINALAPEQRRELSEALVPGLVLEVTDAQLAALFMQTPARLEALVGQLDAHDRLIIDDAPRWLAEASAVARGVVAQKLDADTDEDLIQALGNTDRQALVGALRALRTLNDDKAIARWLALASDAERDLARQVLAVELVSLEIQMGIKIGTDAFKTKSQAPRYFQRGREYLQTATALKLGDQPVPYGKGLLRKLPALGKPDLNDPAWREIYAHCKHTYGNPARIMERMLEELSPPFAREELDAAVEEYAKQRAAEKTEPPSDDAPQPAVDPSVAQLEELDAIFAEKVYPKLGSHEPQAMPPRTSATAHASKAPAQTLAEPAHDDRAPELPRDDAQVARAPGGIANAGNTCYLAAVLQLIAATPVYRRALEAAKVDGEVERLRERCLEIVRLLDAGTRVDIERIRAIQDSLVRIDWLPAEARNAQQDASELLTQLLDRFGANSGLRVERERVHPPSETGGVEAPEQTLSITGLGAGRADRGRTMSQLVRANYRNTPRAEDDEVRRERLAAVPDTLTIDVGRHGYSTFLEAPFRRQELIHDPLRFTLDAELAPDRVARDYLLTAVVVHRAQGSVATQGHYVTYVQRDGHWWYCNDDAVTQVDAETVASAAGLGYVLVYQRDGAVAPLGALAQVGVEPPPVDAREDDAHDEPSPALAPSDAKPPAQTKRHKKRAKKVSKQAQPSTVATPSASQDAIAPLLSAPVSEPNVARAILQQAATLDGPLESAKALALYVATKLKPRLEAMSVRRPTREIIAGIRALGEGLNTLRARYPGVEVGVFNWLFGIAASSRETDPSAGAQAADFLVVLRQQMGLEVDSTRTVLGKFGYRGL